MARFVVSIQLYVAMASFSSQFHTGIAHKRPATLEWSLPRPVQKRILIRTGTCVFCGSFGATLLLLVRHLLLLAMHLFLVVFLKLHKRRNIIPHFRNISFFLPVLIASVWINCGRIESILRGQRGACLLVASFTTNFSFNSI